MHAGLEGFRMPPDEAVRAAARSLRLLADPTRMKILWALAQGESSVSCLADLSGASPTAVSQHLAKLRLAGLVTDRRQGSFIYYSVADGHVTRLLADAVAHAAGDPAAAEPLLHRSGDDDHHQTRRTGRSRARSGSSS
jgi:DNA-binding transcriptional ArsR family regulator